MMKFAYGLAAASALCVAGMLTTVAPAEARGPSFEITLGDVQFGYVDGYYDSHRHWHRWHNSQERKWYQQHHNDAYFGMNHGRDNDHNRKDWRNGKRDNWH